MSSCISGGGRAAYRLNLEIIKSPSTSWASHSSSPSSTLSESSNSPCAISTRRPRSSRTPRKRPNQTYDEAAAILSTAYPKIFSTNHTTKPCKFTNTHGKSSKNNPMLLEPSDLLDNSCFLLHPSIQERPPHFPMEPRCEKLFQKTCQSPGEIDSQSNPFEDIQEDFDAESILDQETEEGIDSIMGNLSMNSDLIDEPNTLNTMQMNTFCYGYPVGLGFGFGFGMRGELKAMRNVDEGDDWWRFPTVNILDLTPSIVKFPLEKKKKKVKKMVVIKNLESGKENTISTADLSSDAGVVEEGSIPKANGGLLLKLNYDDVLTEWSDKGSPFSGDSPAIKSNGGDVQVRLAQIDLFGGEGKTIVSRYKEKRCTRLFSKKSHIKPEKSMLIDGSG